VEGGSVRYLWTIALVKWPLSVGPKASANLGQLDSPTHSNAEATRTHLAGEIGPRSYTAYSDYLPLIAAVSASAFDPATRGEDTTSQPSVAGRQKADQLSQITKAND